MAKIETLKEILYACGEYSVSRVKFGDIEVEFNPEVEETTIPRDPPKEDDDLSPRDQMYSEAIPGGLPKFNKE